LLHKHMIYELPKTEDTTVTIRNRSDRDLFVVTKVVAGSDPAKLAFIAHGFNDVHDSRNLRAMTGPLLRAGYRVVLWDATNSRGRSEGNPKDVLLSSYLNDCEDVIAWARQKVWFHTPYLLGGHSMGGATAGIIASRHSDEVERLLLLSPLVSGWRVSKRVSPVFRIIDRYNRKRRKAGTQPFWLSWEIMRDLMRDLRRYDLISVSYRLNFPTLIIVGKLDPVTTVSDQRLLCETLPKGQLEIVKGAGHNFTKPASREAVANLVTEWIG
jgi:pimeloyl-ACP methyl ester carboxylesterase